MPRNSKRRASCTPTIASTHPPITRRAISSEIQPSTHHPNASPRSAGPIKRHTGRHDPCAANAGYASRSAAINNGKAKPTDSRGPYKSANNATERSEIPLKPAFDNPIKNAANKPSRRKDDIARPPSVNHHRPQAQFSPCQTGLPRQGLNQISKRISETTWAIHPRPLP
ncbi:MAG: hypothetical protein RLY69_849 [Verrucomicrobiota bacterium]